ncbi:arrestin homolog [Homarus americanus]|uniref:arrestin homolog n=1 Tax=Homarus americanus TaxID=6706 RepID=UPI001C448B3A|nr:arrestin homolog [Homarus americanus]XP_042221500.1 arrestin homolog [Homarus americanus]
MVNAVKVFKKTAPNGKVTAYLSRRDFVDHITHTSPVDGVVVVDNDYLRGRRVYARVAVTYRYGREEDEVMGLHFSKEMEVVNTEVAPNVNTEELTDVQERLIKKLGGNAHAFTVTLPQTAPCSVTLESGDDTSAQPLGVTFDLRIYVADRKEENPHRRNSVSFAVRKVQFASSQPSARQPQTLVSKSFTFSPGKLNMEVSLDRDVYFHGQAVEAKLSINNCSKKTVKNIKAQVVQHMEVTMTNSHFSRVVSSLESREGCPITPGANFNKTFSLTPVASSNQKRFGIALDGRIKDQDANLASSTMAATGKNVNDALGIIVSYSLRVKLNCGAIGGELAADLPFKLMHPDPTATKATLRKMQSTDNFEFEEFARLRRGQSVAEE